MRPYDHLADFEAIRSLALLNADAAAAQLALQSHLQTNTIVRVYYGPPGTGKTLQAVRDAVLTVDPGFADGADFSACFRRMNELHQRVSFITFHPSLQYEDVVESIRPRLSSETADEGDEEPTKQAELRYMHYQGPIMRLANEALKSPHLQFAIIIDEINRGDVSRILGPLLSAIEPDKRAGGEYPIGFERQYPERTDIDSRAFLPANLHVFGTMNSADRNIALVDYALRRRFEFVACPPEAHLLGATEGEEQIDMRKLLAVLNDRIAYLLDDDHRIGHSYFMRLKSASDLLRVFAERILPLLFEYFYGNEQLVALVLGDRPDGTPNVLSMSRGSDFKKLFGLAIEEAAGLGAATRPHVSVQVDRRFWNAEKLPAGPDDAAYAFAALRKVYAPATASAEAEAPVPAASDDDVAASQ